MIAFNSLTAKSTASSDVIIFPPSPSPSPSAASSYFLARNPHGTVSRLAQYSPSSS
eukprot:CAMPEP_0113573954 /NCGR_PEP_ID=MMETSP0015_2-20120614/26892_1 /TAXON_ID=2838 /ORGANISM="Odontella" /LENGTH=55 /DNA_ID=CAMNT_0000477065 /DNA_START=20 /DNA_END=184 /DNA_ORIENTATION=- /assembly_acc=CAM_ASM_000160